MATINTVILVGNVTRDPLHKTLKSGTLCTELSLALNHAWKDQSGVKQESVTFIDCVLYGAGAAPLAQYTRKGHLLGITGRLHQDMWTTLDGSKRSKLSVIIDQFVFLTPRSQAGTAADAPPPPDNDTIPY